MSSSPETLGIPIKLIDAQEYAVPREKITELLGIITSVLQASELVKGEVVTGLTFDSIGRPEPILEAGKVIMNPRVAVTLLPTQPSW